MADETAAPTEATEDQPAVEVDQGADVTSTAELETPFRLEDVDEAYRADVQRYVEQTKPVLTRKFQEAASLRAEAQQALDLQERLGSEDTQQEALRELLDQHGYEFAEDEDYEDEGDEYEQEDDEEVDPTLEYLLAQEEARQERESSDSEFEQRERITADLDQVFADYAKKEGVKELPEVTRNALVANALALPALPDGNPNFEGAIEWYEAARAHEIERYIATKRVPTLDTAGSSGVSKVDLMDDKQRVAKAMAVAERHYAA